MQVDKSPRAKGAASLIGVGKSTFYRLAKRPDFPRERRLSPRLVVYDRDELIAWRDAQSDKAKGLDEGERSRLGEIGRRGRSAQLLRRAALTGEARA